VPTTAPYVVTTVATTTSTIPPITYVIQAGDTLGAIASNWEVTVEDIMAKNGLESATSLQVGDKIIIPLQEAENAEDTESADGEGSNTTPATTYLIQAGDTLGAIASNWNVTVDAIMTENGLESATSLKIGDEIIIPTPEADEDTADEETAADGTDGATPDANAVNTYVIQAGDTLGAIASNWNVTVDEIVAENGLGSATSLKVGDEIVIPTPGGDDDEEAVATSTSATTQPE
jgi:LysM repeat protein